MSETKTQAPLRGPGELISVAEAERTMAALVRESLGTPAEERVSLARSTGRTLARAVPADRDGPPYNRAMMDGIAVRASDWNRANTAGEKVKRIAVHAAGADPGAAAPDGHPKAVCVEITTGASVPHGFDAVIPYESLEERDINGSRYFNSTATAEPAKTGMHIHPRGADYRKDQPLLMPGTRVTSSAAAILATCGVTEVPVRRRPRVAILSTGDELVSVDRRPQAYQIRASNQWSLRAELEGWGFPVSWSGLVDDNTVAIRDRVQELVRGHDIIVLSGAMSRGLYDSVPSVLAELGVRVDVHGVRQKPGKPLLLGTAGSTLVVGLPGNPVSSLVCLRRYLVPALAGWEVGETPEAADLAFGVSGLDAILASDISFPAELTYFPAVRLAAGDGLTVEAIAGHGSGDMYQLVGSFGVAEIPQATAHVRAGSTVRVYPWAQ
ncbi:MAG: molybdopterin molybdotransferase MoeA [Spirochaetales bacterium]